MTFSIEAIPSQKGKIAIITGANIGLGYENTFRFVQKDIEVIMACRSKKRAMTAMNKLLAEVPNAKLDFMQLDLCDLSSVRKFAQNFRGKYSKLNYLINNAGIMVPPYSKTNDGFESQMAANHFGHFLLTSLLLDLVPDTTESRIVSLSSVAHRQGPKKIFFDDINWNKRYSSSQAYQQSKLACLMFANELDRRLKHSGKKILSVAAHPGATTGTDLGKHVPKLLFKLIQITILPFISQTVTSGALPQIMAALSPQAQGGDYYGPQGFLEMKGPPGLAKKLPYSEDNSALKKLWDISVELTGADFGELA
ncbi:SDR family NAD(P)-dependent oxidoreductase [Planctomycetota bacterium]|nr:SDR family NAD(P)-dependent oxidoreductase [Planctomycetota bacterium]